MLTQHDKQRVKGVLDGILGYGDIHKGDEISYHCPFCHHHKKKLQVNLKKQFWHCWVCDAKGRSIYSLAKRLNHDSFDVIDVIGNVYKNTNFDNSHDDSENVSVKLPPEFIPLYTNTESKSILRTKAISYLSSRGIGMPDIRKYMIGYCQSGLYANMVIIPSFDKRNKLNYFVGRRFIDSDDGWNYKVPPISKNIIFFENHINWNEPVTLVEGVFDAIAVKRNVIPLLGKFIQKKLQDALYLNNTKTVVLFLDSDANKQSNAHSEKFMKNGIKVKQVVCDGKDPSSIGFEESNRLIMNTNYLTWDSLLIQKIQL